MTAGAIDNPAKLINAAQIERCAQCHSDGHDLADPMPEDLLIANQANALVRSECYIQSGHALSCSTCHSPHEDAKPGDRRYVQACLSCHGAAAPRHAAVLPRECHGRLHHLPHARGAEGFFPHGGSLEPCRRRPNSLAEACGHAVRGAPQASFPAHDPGGFRTAGGRDSRLARPWRVVLRLGAALFQGSLRNLGRVPGRDVAGPDGAQGGRDGSGAGIWRTQPRGGCAGRPHHPRTHAPRFPLARERPVSGSGRAETQGPVAGGDREESAGARVVSGLPASAPVSGDLARRAGRRRPGGGGDGDRRGAVSARHWSAVEPGDRLLRTRPRWR